MDPISTPRLADFLVTAKRRTYAGRDDDATVAAPILRGSKQLEYSEPNLTLQLRFCFEVRALGGGLVSSTPE
jgi:hypothetical protein